MSLPIIGYVPAARGGLRVHAPPVREHDRVLEELEGGPTCSFVVWEEPQVVHAAARDGRIEKRPALPYLLQRIERHAHRRHRPHREPSRERTRADPIVHGQDGAGKVRGDVEKISRSSVDGAVG